MGKEAPAQAAHGCGGSPSLEAFEVRLDSEHPIGLWVSLFLAEQWEQMAFNSLFQLNDSMIL